MKAVFNMSATTISRVLQSMDAAASAGVLVLPASRKEDGHAVEVTGPVLKVMAIIGKLADHGEDCLMYVTQ